MKTTRVGTRGVIVLVPTILLGLVVIAGISVASRAGSSTAVARTAPISLAGLTRAERLAAGPEDTHVVPAPLVVDRTLVRRAAPFGLVPPESVLIVAAVGAWHASTTKRARRYPAAASSRSRGPPLTPTA